MVVLRGLERVGVCLLMGCGVALVLMAVAYWRGREVGVIGAAALGLAAVCGIGWAMVARPTRMASAGAADKQLGLHDLLTTALILRRMEMTRNDSGADQEFAGAMLLSAEAATVSVNPSAIVLNRFGARSWGGIGLAVALVGAMAMLGGDPAATRAGSVATVGPKSWMEVEEQQGGKGNEMRIAAAPDLRRSRPGTGEDADDPLKSGSSAEDQTTTNIANAPAAADGGAGASRAGVGAGAGQSTASGKGGAIPPAAGGTNAAGASSLTGSGGTGAAESGNAGDGGSTAGATAGTTTGRRPAPPWRSAQWAADQAGARQAVAEGRVPDAYREMVRDYFERD